MSFECETVCTHMLEPLPTEGLQPSIATAPPQGLCTTYEKLWSTHSVPPTHCCSNVSRDSSCSCNKEPLIKDFGSSSRSDVALPPCPAGKETKPFFPTPDVENIVQDFARPMVQHNLLCGFQQQKTTSGSTTEVCKTPSDISISGRHKTKVLCIDSEPILENKGQRLSLPDECSQRIKGGPNHALNCDQHNLFRILKFKVRASASHTTLRTTDTDCSIESLTKLAQPTGSLYWAPPRLSQLWDNKTSLLPPIQKQQFRNRKRTPCAEEAFLPTIPSLKEFQSKHDSIQTDAECKVTLGDICPKSATPLATDVSDIKKLADLLLQRVKQDISKACTPNIELSEKAVTEKPIAQSLPETTLQQEEKKTFSRSSTTASLTSPLAYDISIPSLGDRKVATIHSSIIQWFSKLKPAQAMDISQTPEPPMATALATEPDSKTHASLMPPTVTAMDICSALDVEEMHDLLVALQEKQYDALSGGDPKRSVEEKKESFVILAHALMLNRIGYPIAFRLLPFSGLPMTPTNLLSSLSLPLWSFTASGRPKVAKLSETYPLAFSEYTRYRMVCSAVPQQTTSTSVTPSISGTCSLSQTLAAEEEVTWMILFIKTEQYKLLKSRVHASVPTTRLSAHRLEMLRESADRPFGVAVSVQTTSENIPSITKAICNVLLSSKQESIERATLRAQSESRKSGQSRPCELVQYSDRQSRAPTEVRASPLSWSEKKNDSPEINSITRGTRDNRCSALGSDTQAQQQTSYSDYEANTSLSHRHISFLRDGCSSANSASDLPIEPYAKSSDKSLISPNDNLSVSTSSTLRVQTGSPTLCEFTSESTYPSELYRTATSRLPLSLGDGNINHAVSAISGSHAGCRRAAGRPKVNRAGCRCLLCHTMQTPQWRFMILFEDDMWMDLVCNACYMKFNGSRPHFSRAGKSHPVLPNISVIKKPERPTPEEYRLKGPCAFPHLMRRNDSKQFAILREKEERVKEEEEVQKGPSQFFSHPSLIKSDSLKPSDFKPASNGTTAARGPSSMLETPDTLQSTSISPKLWDTHKKRPEANYALAKIRETSKELVEPPLTMEASTTNNLLFGTGGTNSLPENTTALLHYKDAPSHLPSILEAFAHAESSIAATRTMHFRKTAVRSSETLPSSIHSSPAVTQLDTKQKNPSALNGHPTATQDPSQHATQQLFASPICPCSFSSSQYELSSTSGYSAVTPTEKIPHSNSSSKLPFPQFPHFSPCDLLSSSSSQFSSSSCVNSNSPIGYLGSLANFSSPPENSDIAQSHSGRVSSSAETQAPPYASSQAPYDSFPLTQNRSGVLHGFPPDTVTTRQQETAAAAAAAAMTSYALAAAALTSQLPAAALPPGNPTARTMIRKTAQKLLFSTALPIQLPTDGAFSISAPKSDHYTQPKKLSREPNKVEGSIAKNLSPLTTPAPLSSNATTAQQEDQRHSVYQSDNPEVHRSSLGNAELPNCQEVYSCCSTPNASENRASNDPPGVKTLQPNISFGSPPSTTVVEALRPWITMMLFLMESMSSGIIQPPTQSTNLISKLSTTYNKPCTSPETQQPRPETYSAKGVEQSLRSSPSAPATRSHRCLPAPPVPKKTAIPKSFSKAPHSSLVLRAVASDEFYSINRYSDNTNQPRQTRGPLVRNVGASVPAASSLSPDTCSKRTTHMTSPAVSATHYVPGTTGLQNSTYLRIRCAPSPIVPQASQSITNVSTPAPQDSRGSDDVDNGGHDPCSSARNEQVGSQWKSLTPSPTALRSLHQGNLYNYTLQARPLHVHSSSAPNIPPAMERVPLSHRPGILLPSVLRSFTACPPPSSTSNAPAAVQIGTPPAVQLGAPPSTSVSKPL